MIVGRLQDVTEINRGELAAQIAKGETPVVQFSAPGYSRALLRELDAACAEFGSALEIRFYGHYGTEFNARCLAYLPNVASLSIDCVHDAINIDVLATLQRLKKLSLGIFDLNRADLLSGLKLAQLEQLTLAQTRRAELDLTPLRQCRALRSLYLTGHRRGFDVLGELTSVRELSLRSISKAQSLAVVNRMTGLRKLTMILGGRDDLDELAHPKIERLDVVWVRGLARLGSLARFPALQHLRVEDELRLRSIDLGEASRTLRRLVIFNCRNLSAIGDFSHLTNLEELRLGRISIDFDTLLEQPRPGSLRCVALYSGRRKADAAMRARLNNLGYLEYPRARSKPRQS